MALCVDSRAFAKDPGGLCTVGRPGGWGEWTSKGHGLWLSLGILDVVGWMEVGGGK